MLSVAVTAWAFPISTRPTGVVPVFALQPLTTFTPSRYRSQLLEVPTVPQSSMLCHPVPSATPEKSCVPAKSERTYRMPLTLMNTFAIGPFDAVRSRSSVVALGSRVATFTFSLVQIVESWWVRFLNANALWDVVWPLALGGATPPVLWSIVSRVTPLQFAKVPLEKSSEKEPPPWFTCENTNRPLDAQSNPSEAGLTSCTVPPTGELLAKSIE